MRTWACMLSNIRIPLDLILFFLSCPWARKQVVVSRFGPPAPWRGEEDARLHFRLDPMLRDAFERTGCSRYYSRTAKVMAMSPAEGPPLIFFLSRTIVVIARQLSLGVEGRSTWFMRADWIAAPTNMLMRGGGMGTLGPPPPPPPRQ